MMPMILTRTGITVEGFKAEKNPKFEIYKDKAGEFRFRLKAANGQIIATGEEYKELKFCKNAIASIKNAPAANIVLEYIKMKINALRN